MEIIAFLVVSPIVATSVLSRTLGARLGRRSFWLGFLSCGLPLPLAAAIWAATWVVPDAINPPAAPVDGFPPGPLLAIYSMVMLPVTLITSFIAVSRAKRP